MNRGFIEEHAPLLKNLLRFFDATTVGVSGWLAYRILNGSWELPERYRLALLVATLLAVIAFHGFSLYRIWRGIPRLREAVTVASAWVVLFVALAALGAATHLAGQFSREWAALWLALGLGTAVPFRLVLRSALHWARSSGYDSRRLVIVGSGEAAARLVRQLADKPRFGFQVVGYFDDRASRHEVDGSVPYLGTFAEVPGFLRENQVYQVWIALPLRAEVAVRRILHELRHTSVQIRYVPDIFDFELLNQSVMQVGDIPVINLSASPLVGWGRIAKAIEDRVIALASLVLMSPLMLLIALGVKLSSPGPVFYRQVRVGWNGHPFTMLKFRSMPVNAEASTGPVWARPGEQRATWLGSFLRKTSLDELPQFINVLRGEMSIVGPRPERPVFVERFKEQIPGYMKKHMVKAGITGWAQVQGWRGDTDLRRRIECDLYYVEHWSLLFDLKIILLTGLKGLVHKNAY